MTLLDLENAFTAAYNAQQWDIVANTLTEDFVWSGSALGSLDKQGFLSAQKAWFAAAPDLRVTAENRREEGAAVHFELIMTGTQTNPPAHPRHREALLR